MQVQTIGQLSTAVSQTSQGTSPAMLIAQPTISASDIDWAIKLDKKMEYGFVPSVEEQRRYNAIVNQLNIIKNEGGYIYQDTTAISSNPRGIAAIGSFIGRGVAGGVVGFKYASPVASVAKGTIDAIKAGGGIGNIGHTLKSIGIGLKNLGSITAKASGISAAISGGASLVTNSMEVLSGRQTGKEAIGNVAADTVGGLLSGVAATGFAGATVLGVAAAGVAGLPLTIIGVSAGAVGALLMDKLYKGSGLFTLLKTKISGLFSS